MGRLIDADWFKSVMLDEPTEWMTEEQLVQFRAMVDLAPTVDAVPTRHGRWVRFGVSDKDGNQMYRCSVCECEEIHSPLVKVNYCWNCGALMDGKDGDS